VTPDPDDPSNGTAPTWRNHVPSAGAFGVAFVLIGAGLLFATSAETARGTQLRSDRPDVQGFIRSEDARLQARTQRVFSLRSEVDALTERKSTTDQAVAATQNKADQLAAAGGLEPVTGPAMRVTLDDAPRNLPTMDGVTPDDLVVHQQDVQAVVNALWAGGAEAMMLQDQRVISTSAVRCVGNTLILNGRTYGPPYTITAIGDVPGMRQALDRSPGVEAYQQWVDVVHLGYDVKNLGGVTLPEYTGSLHLEHATVDDPSRAGQETPTQSSSPENS
jgi:uncharacterized protein YlxW (UPF0749 family)